MITSTVARIYPFQAWRYNASKVRLQDVVTQPYDKINPALQQAYYQRSPYNLVRIILGLPEMFDSPANNVYTRAAGDFLAWRQQAILVRDAEPAVYAYAQTYALPGRPTLRMERRGFIALSDVLDYAAGIVFRHEQTLAKPKSDRLQLLRATRAHFGQIFMLYSDPAQTAEKLLFAEGAAPDAEVTDDFEVTHRVWKVTDPGTINKLIAGMADKKLIIADGHHRYETALAYARERRPVDEPERQLHGVYQAPSYPEAAVMMTFVNMESPGLTILATHRVVSGLKDFSAEKFLASARKFYDVAPLSAGESAKQHLGGGHAVQRAGTIFAVMRDGDFALTPLPQEIAAALPELSERQRSLDVAHLHGILLHQVLGLSPESIAQQTHVHYVRDAQEAVASVRTGEAQIAFVLRPATLEQLRSVALAGEVMPQKSTDFYPKMLSGLAIYALD